MNLVPKSVTRAGGRALLKLNASSPTILVVSGVIGLGATAVLAARATRKIDPILDEHKQARAEIGYVGNSKNRQKDLVRVYTKTGYELTKLYGPTLFVGTTSAVAVLGGHKILRGRQIATLAAYSSLADQFQSYRKRVVDTLGEKLEREIYEGAHGEWVEDPDHKGEYKLEPKYDKTDHDHYLRPWFDETNVNWTRSAKSNYLFLKGHQAHMNRLLNIRGHVFLNDVFDALSLPRTREGQITGWLYNNPKGDNFVDFGFMTGQDPHTVAFRNEVEKTVRLNFNIDRDPIFNLI
jgi:hypothetical protein